MPVSISLGIGDEYQIYSNSALDAYNVIMTGNFFKIGASIFKYFQVSQSMRIQPALGVNIYNWQIES